MQGIYRVCLIVCKGVVDRLHMNVVRSSIIVLTLFNLT